jgi:acyl transferase domain-containing protein
MASKKNQGERVDGKVYTTPIAIIGMASIFAQAENLQEYWDNILRKIDCVVDVPASRWNIDDYYDPDPRTPDKSYCKRGAFIPDIDFDPMEFGLPPNILEITDVSQLLGLVVAKEAMQDAGYGEGKDFNRDRAGVILGMVGVSSKLYTPLMARLQYPVWEKVLLASGVSKEDTQVLIEKMKLAYVGWEENAFPGTIGNVVAGRIANRLDLGGTNCVVDAACATSLAALRMAIGELSTGRADLMITGGVDTDNSIGSYLCFSKTPAFSKGERVRTFDADTDGMMSGEGLGMLVLKRLADAERDGDRIYAVIKGVGSSSDGRYKSIYAPRSSGQASAIRRAYEEAGFEPKTVGLVEAHGTGTMAGDPAEFQGLREVFEAGNARRQSVALGSVKSQIAHTKAAAGSASLIKTVMALHHKVLPATINVKNPNPKLDVENSPFYINTETRPWLAEPGIPRRAGVSSFGFGGTNFHVALEEYQSEQQGPYRRGSVPSQVLIHADSPELLMAKCTDTLAQLKSETGKVAFVELVNASRAAVVPSSAARVGFVAADLLEAQQMLQTVSDRLREKPGDEAWDHPKGIYYRRSGMDTSGKVVALFSGQGSQYLEMGRELATNFPELRMAYSEMDSLFASDNLPRLSGRVFPPPVFTTEERDRLSADLTRTEHAQPAIGVMSVALYRMLKQAGLKADFAAGHSFGELAALWAAGVLSDENYMALAKARGKAMAAPNDPTFDAGTMLAVKGDMARIREDLQSFPEITLANWNSTNQVVLAGSKAAIAEVQPALEAKGYSVIPLPVSAAFHTSLVGHAQKPFADTILATKFNSPKMRVFSNTTGQAYPSDTKEIQNILSGHILKPVLWKDEIEAIYAEGGRVFIEFGPKNILTNLVGNILEGKPHLAVAMNASPKKDSDRQMREAVIQLRVAGVELNDIDPYEMPRNVVIKKRKPTTVTLNGGYYVSEKTRSAFDKTLQDGFKIQQAVAQTQPTAAAPIAAPAPVPAAVVVPTAVKTPAPAPVQANSAASGAAFAALQETISQFQGQQGETARIHSQYLRNEEEYARTFSQLTQTGLNLLSGGQHPSDQLGQLVSVVQGLERSMERFHAHQSEALHAHEQYLKSQETFSQDLIRLIEQQFQSAPSNGHAYPTPTAPVHTAAPVVAQPIPAASNGGNGKSASSIPVQAVIIPPAPVSAPAAPPAPAAVQAVVISASASAEDVTVSLLNVVSEKTGYPAEMLEMDMDMEADLGIDSIKRVEIFGAMRAIYPDLPKVDPEVFAELRTLGQVGEHIRKTLPGTPTASTTPITAAPVVVETAVTAAAPSGSSPSADAVSAALLAVVSEKTGYPAEMLESDMDMEADLGIDSIKRVEIFGAMRAIYPDLPKVDPEVFAELRTLGQVCGHIQTALTSDTSTPVPTAPAASAPATVPVTVHPASSSTASADDVSKKLLEVVSEKTGYPAEMLEMDMDMEADLGIDSIKRVEIFAAMRNYYPDLPKVDPEVFAELRTLGQVCGHIQTAVSGGAPEPASVSAAVEPTLEAAGISRSLVVLKALPTPDYLEESLPVGHICLLTDDGTETTTALAAELQKRNIQPVVLSFPAEVSPVGPALPTGVQRVMLANMSESGLEQALKQITEKHGKVAAVIHLNAKAAAQGNAGDFSEQQKAIVKHVFLLAKHLKESVNTAARQGMGAFISVVRLDGQFGLGELGDFDPVSGGLFGLVKSLNLEWDSVFCRGIDLSPVLNASQSVERILAELFDPNRLVVEVSYTPEGRFTLVVEDEMMSEAAR